MEKFFVGDKLKLFSTIDGFARTGETVIIQGHDIKNHVISMSSIGRTTIELSVLVIGVMKDGEKYTATITEQGLREKVCNHTFINSDVKYEIEIPLTFFSWFLSIFKSKIKAKNVKYLVCQNCGYREEYETPNSNRRLQRET